MITFSQLGNPQWGRLGNQLFQIACTLGVAHQNGHSVIFPAWPYARYFAQDLPEGKLLYPKIWLHTSIFYEPIELPSGNWDLQGFFSSEKFFEKIIIDIRKQFEPSLAVSAYINQKYGSLLARQPCSIHIRRGDYLKLSWDFPVQPLSYYQHAIRQFPPYTSFLIFSDDIAWCKKHFIGPQFEFIENEEDIIDLLLMSRCSNHIIANSTFSWWGAWLNPNPSKIVLCPALWYGPGVTAHPKHDARDLYAKGFQPLVMPNEREWQVSLYYAIAHPLYSGWSKVHKLLHRLYGMETVRLVVKKLKSN